MGSETTKSEVGMVDIRQLLDMLEFRLFKPGDVFHVSDLGATFEFLAGDLLKATVGEFEDTWQLAERRKDTALGGFSARGRRREPTCSESGGWN